MKNKIHLQDCIPGMRSLDANSIPLCVTSPPYNLDIQYGTYKDKLPRESYLLWLNDVFEEIARVLENRGHFFLNVGYSNIDPWVGMDVANIARKHFILQNNITWVKSIYVDGKTSGHFKPINSDRFVNPTWEHIFHFTKTGDITVDKLGAGVQYEWIDNIDKTNRIKGRVAKKMGFKNIKEFHSISTEEQKQHFANQLEDRLNKSKPQTNKRCRGNTWFIPYDTIANRSTHRGSHPATFPIELVKQCIRLSGIKDGMLLDPFMGTGTSAVAAKQMELDYIGYDIDQSYINYAENRINAETKQFEKKQKNAKTFDDLFSA